MLFYRLDGKSWRAVWPIAALAGLSGPYDDLSMTAESSVEAWAVIYRESLPIGESGENNRGYRISPKLGAETLSVPAITGSDFAPPATAISPERAAWLASLATNSKVFIRTPNRPYSEVIATVTSVTDLMIYLLDYYGDRYCVYRESGEEPELSWRIVPKERQQ